MYCTVHQECDEREIASARCRYCRLASAHVVVLLRVVWKINTNSAQSCARDLTGQGSPRGLATASGKTEAACAPLVERNIGRLHPWTVLYVSPTRALVNDLYQRLSTLRWTDSISNWTGALVNIVQAAVIRMFCSLHQNRSTVCSVEESETSPKDTSLARSSHLCSTKFTSCTGQLVASSCVGSSNGCAASGSKLSTLAGQAMMIFRSLP